MSSPAQPLADAPAYYRGAVPRVAAFLRNGTFDFAGFKRAVARAGDLARGHFTLAPVVTRAANGFPALASHVADAARAWLVQVCTGGFQQAMQECTQLAVVYPMAARDLAIAHQVVAAQLENIQARQETPALANPVSAVLHQYALAHARWLSSRDVQGAEGAAKEAQGELDAALASARQAQQAITAALTAVKSQPITDAIARAEQSAWVNALSNAVPRTLG